MSVDDNMRGHILEVLDFIADEGAQRAYQAEVPAVSVSNEIFNKWDDCYPVPESVLSLFSPNQRAALARFDDTLKEVAASTPVDLPPLLLFMETQHWKRLNQAAKLALNDLL